MTTGVPPKFYAAYMVFLIAAEKNKIEVTLKNASGGEIDVFFSYFCYYKFAAESSLNIDLDILIEFI